MQKLSVMLRVKFSPSIECTPITIYLQNSGMRNTELPAKIRPKIKNNRLGREVRCSLVFN